MKKLSVISMIIILSACQQPSHLDNDSKDILYKSKENFTLPDQSMNYHFSSRYDLPDLDIELTEPDDEDQLIIPPTLMQVERQVEEFYPPIEFNMTVQEVETKLNKIFKAMTLADDQYIQYLKSDLNNHRFWFKIKGKQSNYCLEVLPVGTSQSTVKLLDDDGNSQPITLASHIVDLLN